MITATGNIPGLLRRGSPVVWNSRPRKVRDSQGAVMDAIVFPGDLRGVVCRVDLSFVCIAADLGNPGRPSFMKRLEETALDLSDATGRAHAAWWAERNATAAGAFLMRPYIDGQLGPKHYDAMVAAGLGLDMEDEAINRLRRIVLHLAGLPA